MEFFLQELDRKRVNLPPLDAGKLKYFACIIMLIDHVACVFLETAHTEYGQSFMYSLPRGELIDSLLRAGSADRPFPFSAFSRWKDFGKHAAVQSTL